MIFAILKLVHALFGAIAIAVGTWMVLRILAAKPPKKLPVVFLKCSLVANATGLLLPFHHLLPTHWAAMSGIYITGMAVLASRKYRLAGIWGSIFAGCTMLVFSLNILVAIAHVFTMLIAPQHKPLFLITEFLAMLFLASLDLLIVRRHRTLSARLAVRPQVAGCN